MNWMPNKWWHYVIECQIPSGFRIRLHITKDLENNHSNISWMIWKRLYNVLFNLVIWIRLDLPFSKICLIVKNCQICLSKQIQIIWIIKMKYRFFIFGRHLKKDGYLCRHSTVSLWLWYILLSTNSKQTDL